MQHNAAKYFTLARAEEMAGHNVPAILFYLVSFCTSLNCLKYFPVILLHIPNIH